MNNFPVVEYTTHESRDLPKLGKVKFRPFVMKEHRLLMEAIQMGSPAEVVDMIGAMIDKATFGKIDAQSQEFHVLEALFLDIYMKSKGSVFPAVYTCHNEVLKPVPLPPGKELAEGEEPEMKMQECGASINVMIPLDRAELVYPEAYQESMIVKLSDTKGVKFKQPNLADFKRFRAENKQEMSLHDELIFASVDCIFDGDRIMTPGVDFNAEGLLEWMETFETDQFEKIVAFFEDVPALTMSIDVTCPKCKHRSKVHLQGLDDFFA